MNASNSHEQHWRSRDESSFDDFMRGFVGGRDDGVTPPAPKDTPNNSGDAAGQNKCES